MFLLLQIFVTVSFAKTLKYIGQYAFKCNETITNIIYDGTITEWDSIIKDNKWFIKSNTNQSIKVTCSDDVIEY